MLLLLKRAQDGFGHIDLAGPMFVFRMSFGDEAEIQCRRRHNERLNVIFDSANLHCGHLVSACDSSDIRPNAFFDRFCEPRLAVLCAESEMLMKRGVGIGRRRSPFSRRYATSSWLLM